MPVAVLVLLLENRIFELLIYHLQNFQRAFLEKKCHLRATDKNCLVFLHMLKITFSISVSGIKL